MSHTLAAARAEIARARRLADAAGPSPAEMRRMATLVARCPAIEGATERVLAAPRGSPEWEAACDDVLTILCGGPLSIEPDPPPMAVVVSAVPPPERPADQRPADLLQSIAAALQGEALLRRPIAGPLPVECSRALGRLARALADHAPGAVAPDRSAPDLIGARHAAWREDHPDAAAGLDRLWRHDPHTAAWASEAAELVARLTVPLMAPPQPLE